MRTLFITLSVLFLISCSGSAQVEVETHDVKTNFQEAYEVPKTGNNGGQHPSDGTRSLTSEEEDLSTP